ncbi:thioredoxin [Bacillus phage Chotacabras]|nr:thioredoxin [Bacillus phage Chotacabras]
MKKLIKLEQPGCAPCAMVSNYLKNELQVPHESIDVTVVPEVAAHYELASVPTVILIEVGKQSDVIGEEIKRSIKFNPEELDELVEMLRN